MSASRSGSHSPESVARSPLGQRIADLLTDVVRGPVVRWRVTNSRGKLVMAFPASKATTEQQARMFAKAWLGNLWRDEYRVDGMR